MLELKRHPRRDEISTAKDRGRVYAILSTVFLRQPDAELVRGYMSLLGEQVNLPGLQRAKNYLETRGNIEDIALELSASFNRLFRGTVPHIPPPYESVYREDILFGEAAARVLRKYRSHGMELREEYRGEPPDYLGFELDFMRFLCEREAEALEKSDASAISNVVYAEKCFVRDHLLSWVGGFRDVVRRHDDKGFYAGWCDFTLEWLIWDYRNLRRKY
jgi:TorA maturation chaperone TorD